jgi:branched-chain amino acid transport system permease protein
MSVGGTLFAQYYLYINPEVVFGSNVSLSFTLMGLLGGVKESLGPIVGSFLYITISEILRVSFGASGSAIAWVIFGSLVFIFASFAREGVSAYFRKLVTSRKPYTVNKHKAKRNFYIEE